MVILRCRISTRAWGNPLNDPRNKLLAFDAKETADGNCCHGATTCVMTFVFKVYRKDWKTNMQAFCHRCVDLDAGICAEALNNFNLGQERPVTEKQFDKDVVVETATW